MTPTANPSSVPFPRGCLGWDGANFYVLRTDANGHLHIHVLSSALPLGAATAAHQVTQNTALQLIDDLAAALKSADTDELHVEGEDQLFSIEDVLWLRYTGVGDGADVTVLSLGVDPGEYWVVTHVAAVNMTSGPHAVQLQVDHDGTSYVLTGELAPGQNESVDWQGKVVLDPGDKVKAYWLTTTNLDALRLYVAGYKMTVA